MVIIKIAVKGHDEVEVILPANVVIHQGDYFKIHPAVLTSDNKHYAEFKLHADSVVKNIHVLKDRVDVTTVVNATIYGKNQFHYIDEANLYNH